MREVGEKWLDSGKGGRKNKEIGPMKGGGEWKKGKCGFSL